MKPEKICIYRSRGNTQFRSAWKCALSVYVKQKHSYGCIEFFAQLLCPFHRRLVTCLSHSLLGNPKNQKQYRFTSQSIDRDSIFRWIFGSILRMSHIVIDKLPNQLATRRMRRSSEHRLLYQFACYTHSIHDFQCNHLTNP